MGMRSDRRRFLCVMDSCSISRSQIAKELGKPMTLRCSDQLEGGLCSGTCSRVSIERMINSFPKLVLPSHIARWFLKNLTKMSGQSLGNHALANRSSVRLWHWLLCLRAWLGGLGPEGVWTCPESSSKCRTSPRRLLPGLSTLVTKQLQNLTWLQHWSNIATPPLTL